MSVLGTLVDRDRIDAIRKRCPNFESKTPIPEDLRYWSEQDIERYFNSNGAYKPQQTARSDLQTCALLTRMRLKLAEDGIGESTAEYRSFCKFFKTARGSWRLPALAAGEATKTAVEDSSAVDLRQGPIIFEKKRNWKARDWNMNYLERQAGNEIAMCFARMPSCDEDMIGIDSFSISGGMHEFVEYMRLVHRMDRKCLEENIVAYPRVGCEAYTFQGSMRDEFDNYWQELGPSSVKDLTASFLEMTSSTMGWDWSDSLRLFYKLVVNATGTITRLHAESAGAHLWLNQVEGRRIFFLFPPSEEDKLYSMPMRSRGEDIRVSPVDVFSPSAKRHPKFSEARYQVATLHLGQTLVIPSGWWWMSVAVEPSVTLSHHFWNSDNRRYFASSLRKFFDAERANGDERDRLSHSIEAVHRIVMGEGDDSDAD